ncbi:NUDIX domain-containing protein [Paenibacillus contaminans]|nr:NUDIX domain-containing protein [Paenibacillus contaminans]
MKLRQMATAFIMNDGRFIMMKKTNSKLFDFEFWTALGGHLEPNEINNARKACLREIFEESGLQENELKELDMRYVLLRQKEDEIRMQFVFFGSTDKTELVPSDEGELHWVEEARLIELNISTIIRKMLEHYSANRDDKRVFVGTMTKTDEDKPSVQWSLMTDPMVF